MISDWIWSGNLHPMFQVLGQVAGYVFEESDWSAVEFGIAGTNSERELWFAYPLIGATRLDVEVAWGDPVAGGDEVVVRIANHLDEVAAARVQTVWSLLNQYEVRSRRHDEP
jgi:hypothetical protein